MPSPGKIGKSYAARRARFAQDLWLEKVRSQAEDAVTTAVVTLIFGGLVGGAAGAAAGGFWGGVIGSIAGAVSVPLLTAGLQLLWRWFAAPSLMWSRQEQEIARLNQEVASLEARLTSNAQDLTPRQAKDRETLYRQAIQCLNAFIDLDNACNSPDDELMSAAELSFRTEFQALNDVVFASEIREADRYGGVIVKIRTALNQPGRVFNRCNTLRPLVKRELYGLLREDHIWDRKRAGLPISWEEEPRGEDNEG